MNPYHAENNEARLDPPATLHHIKRRRGRVYTFDKFDELVKSRYSRESGNPAVK